MNDTPETLAGADYIRQCLKDTPSMPGVYQMQNIVGDILYIGKARNLRNRLASYANARHPTYRIMKMVEQVRHIHFTVTQSEAEALLLEATLIKKHRPRYNILLKDDKSFPYIVFEDDHPFPRISKHRGSHKKEHSYFGPFASVGAANKTLALLQRAFLLRPCSDSIFTNRSRPCLQYQIKRCSAPCAGYISEDDYAFSVNEAKQFLQGKSRHIQDRLAKEMQRLSEEMAYEQAASMRDRIKALTQVQQEQSLQLQDIEEADILALARDGAYSAVQVFFIRHGQHFGSQCYFPKHDAEADNEDILTAFIGQFYQNNRPANLILVSEKLEESEWLSDALSLRLGRKVQLSQPVRGERRQSMEQALINAKSSLERHMNQRVSEQAHRVGLKKLFDLKTIPERIEVYDNSHLMGGYALGAMIVAGAEGFDKRHYRQFNIKDTDIEPGDDYAMMREVLRRRFGRLKREDPERVHGHWPDLVLIDGGAGQLSAACETLQMLGLPDVALVAIAKGPDRNAGKEVFFMPGREPFSLAVNDPLLHYLQRLRDEAHRFAIGNHRLKRAKSITQSVLDDIPGIGASRKRALLMHFGSKRAIENASLTELERTPGINKKIAQQIYDYFHGTIG